MHTTSMKLYACLFGACVLAATAGGLAFSQRQSAGGPRGESAVEGPREKASAASEPAWKERLVLRGYAGSAYGEFSPDGRTFATTDGRNVLRFLDTATWKERSRCPLSKYPKGTYYPQWHPFSPDGRLFVLAWRVPAEGGKGNPRFETWLIEPATGKVRTVLEGNWPRFSPTGTLLAVHRPDTVILYDHAADKEVRRLPTGKPVAWRGDWFSPDGRRLFLPTDDGRGKLWDVETGKPLATLEGFNPHWSRDGKSLATILPGPLVKLWDTTTGKERATLRGFSQPGCSAEFSPDGRLVLTSVWEARLRADGELDFPKGGSPYRPKRVRLDVRLWDARTGKELVRLPGEHNHCRGGTFSPDGKTVAYVRLTDGPGYQMEAVLWDVAAAKERLVLRDDEGIDGVSFSPDGATVLGHVGGGDQARLYQWDAAAGRVRARFDGRGVCKFSSDGKLMVLEVQMPVKGPLTGSVPTPMELRIFQWSAGPVIRETRGEPIKIEQKPAEKPKPLSEAAKALAAVKKEAETSTGVFVKQYATAKIDAERQKLQRAHLTALEGFTARALDVAQKYAKDPAAVDALEFALRYTAGMEGKLGALGEEAIARVRETLLTSPTLDKLLPWLGHHLSASSLTLLREALDKNPDRVVRGRACYWLAQTLAEQADAARLLRQSPELADRPEAKDRQEHIKRLRATDPDATARRAEELFERLRKDFADVKRNDFQPTTLGELASRALFALRHLAVGKTAPEVEGKDLDGEPLKLSEYRGKVVVLIFCGHWCGPCRVMNPHKQELVKRHAGKPFALLEVNSDTDAEDWKRVMKKEGYTWRCWADGGTEGPISKQWNVSRWPTIYVLDPKGVIRYKEVGDEALGKAVDTLLAEGAKE